MGLFGKGKSGGLMNVIRCDEQEYLVWKWRPEGQAVNTTSRENSIRYGSSLRVKDGEAAVFVYKQENGTVQDLIYGPYDGMIETGNFPVLAGLVGAAFGGTSPFQAEIYFFNLQQNNQIRFAVPYFDVFDFRLPDHGIPLAVRGTLTFCLSDCNRFIKLNRLVNFELSDFKRQIQPVLSSTIKSIVMDITSSANGVPVVQIERYLSNVNETASQKLNAKLDEQFGIRLRELNIDALDVDKSSPYYKQLRELTAGNTARVVNAETDVKVKNLQDIQRISAENLEETLKIQREESQRARRLQTESSFLGAHALDQQADVLKAGAESLGMMAGGASVGDGGGFNPAGIMAGMAIGGAMGQQLAGMMNNMGQSIQSSINTPPPPPIVQFFVLVNGQQSGPFQLPQLQQLVATGQLTQQTYVWKQGMPQWALAGQVPELASLFNVGAGTPPPPPPVL